MGAEKIFAKLDKAPARDEVLDILADCYRDRGFNAFCFIVPMITSPDQFKLYERGMPEDWMKRYLENNYNLIDPIPKATVEHGKVATLREIIAKLTPSDVERAFLDEFEKSGVTNGLVIPTKGLHNADGFFGLDMISEERLAEVDKSFLTAVAQHAHLRIDRIELEQGDGHSRLSTREREVLKWVSAGKSNPDIAIILDLSEATVSTYLKRIFDKLQVHDRVSAALAGFKLGVLR